MGLERSAEKGATNFPLQCSVLGSPKRPELCLHDLASMVSPSNTPASERARLEERLALIDLLIALSDEGVGSQRVLAEQSGLEGEALAQVLYKLTVFESSNELRRTERKRLLETLLALESR